jgi:predicted DNA-binding transcriptional regulator YafY
MTALQLSRELEVCERTIYRDIDALSTAGVPVYGEAGIEGGFELLGSYKTNLTGLSEGEARALFMLNMPGPLARLGLSKDLKAAMLKLTAALPELRRRDEERVRQRFYIDASWPAQEEEPLPHLQTIQQAVWEDRRLFITYIPLFEVQIERVIEPYGLTSRAGVWHLVFQREGRIRARRVSSLIDVRLCSDTFERPTDFDLGEFWRKWCSEEESRSSAYTVTIRAAENALAGLSYRFGSRVRSQLATAPIEPDGSRILKLSFLRLEEARDRLLPFGGGVEVLDPETLRLSIADVAMRIVNVYRAGG